jgi:putative cardiolipin synthase
VLPASTERRPERAPVGAPGGLGSSRAPLAAAPAGTSGVTLLQDGFAAFAARALLADSAERALDVQYYIWHDDLSGTLLLEALHRAADRGVKVRLLLDDNNTLGLDATLAALDSHPNVEVRLFNPYRLRRLRLLELLVDFPRLNRRMHNKSFTADALVTIIGGRNVGDEYFGASKETLFLDLDVLAVGPVAADVSRDFERYWTSASAWPASRVIPGPAPDGLTSLRARAARLVEAPEAREFVQALETESCVRALVSEKLTLEWAPTRMVSDDPAKGLSRAKRKGLLWNRLQDILGPPSKEVLLVSPYFVPTAWGVAFFRQLVARGVDVVVLTNALEATDVVAVHAGYAKRRRALLSGGVELFELKRTALRRPVRGRLKGGSSASSLHAKTFSVDRARVFVGSFNFDPRSAKLNTEMGFVIDSAAIGAATSRAFLETIPAACYRVTLDGRGRLTWVERGEGGDVVHRGEPGATRWQRVLLAVLERLPIEWLL